MEGATPYPPEPPDATAAPPSEFEPYPTSVESSPSQDAATAPSPPSAEPAEWETRLSAAEERARAAEQQNAQLNQGFAELQRLMQQAEAQAARARLEAESQTRIQSAYQMAADMDPETALQYVRRAEEAERTHLARQIQETEEQAERRLFEVVSQVAAPQYIRTRAQELGIPTEYTDLLAGVPAHLVDQVLPIVQLFTTREKHFNEQLSQLGRSTNAAAMVASGAYNPSGNGATPVRPETSKFDPASPDYEPRAFLANILERAGVLRSR